MSRVRVTCSPRWNRRAARQLRETCACHGRVGPLSAHRPWSFTWATDSRTLPAWVILVTGATVEELP